MRILLVLFYSASPTPVYPQLALELRSAGHTVWLGAPNVSGDMTWHDGTKTVGVQHNPEIPQSIASIPGLGRLARWLRDVIFLIRVRRFIAATRADVVQIDPPSRAWLLSLFQSQNALFVFDKHQLAGVDESSAGKVKVLWRMLAMRIMLRFFFDHACFQ
jgi:hypothetical protein